MGESTRQRAAHLRSRRWRADGELQAPGEPLGEPLGEPAPELPLGVPRGEAVLLGVPQDEAVAAAAAAAAKKRRGRIAAASRARTTLSKPLYPASRSALLLIVRC